MGELPTLITPALDGGPPSFKIDAGRYIRKLFVGGFDAPYELQLNMGTTHFFNMRDDWKDYPGVNATFFLSVSMKEPGSKFLWKSPPSGRPVGGSCKDLGDESTTAHHAMYKAVKRLHEWVSRALSGEV